MVQQHPAHRALAVVAFSLAVLGALALGMRPNTPFGDSGTEAQATITGSALDGGARFAQVQFVTAAGLKVVTQITVCHHQSYAVGSTIKVLYNAQSPMQAVEKEMVGSHFQVPPAFALEAIGGVVILGLVLRRRRHAPQPVETPEPGPTLDDELVVLLATEPAAQEDRELVHA